MQYNFGLFISRTLNFSWQLISQIPLAKLIVFPTWSLLKTKNLWNLYCLIPRLWLIFEHPPQWLALGPLTCFWPSPLLIQSHVASLWNVNSFLSDLDLWPYPTFSRHIPTLKKFDFPHLVDHETLSILCSRNFWNLFPLHGAGLPQMQINRNTIRGSLAKQKKKKGNLFFLITGKVQRLSQLDPYIQIMSSGTCLSASLNPVTSVLLHFLASRSFYGGKDGTLQLQAYTVLTDMTFG